MLTIVATWISTEQLWYAEEDPHTWLDTDSLLLPLEANRDGVGVVLILFDTILPVTDSAFRSSPSDWDPGHNINYAVQHWRHIEAPILDSARVDGTNVALWWRNRHENRDIDSTWIHRTGGLDTMVGHDVTTWTDSGVPQGGYTYYLKHWTRPVVWHGGQFAYPNSAASNSINVQVDTSSLPPPPTVVMDGPTYIVRPRNYTWTLDVTGTSPLSYAWWLKPFGPGTSWQLVDTTSSYTRYVGYSDMGFQLRIDVTDPYQQLAADTLAVSTQWGYGPLTGVVR